MRRAFDVSTAAQVAALASLGDEAELGAPARAVRRGARARVEMLERAGFDVAGPAVANFVYAETGSDARAVFDALLREGVIVRPLQRLRLGDGDPRDDRNRRRRTTFSPRRWKSRARAATK